jgi:hypothetical protein
MRTIGRRRPGRVHTTAPRWCASVQVLAFSEGNLYAHDDRGAAHQHRWPARQRRGSVVSARQRAGGIARQAQIKAVLGENGYRRYQQALARAGGIARQAQLRAALGEPGYCRYQRSLYQRAVSKHGAAKMHEILTAAHERRRCWRIANPTPAEALLHWLALEAGLTLHADLTGSWEWTQYRFEPTRWPWSPTDALIEARVLGYACDLLLPTHALVIEALGGIHALTVERDAARVASLRTQGLAVITLTNEQLYSGEADDLFATLLEVRRAA